MAITRKTVTAETRNLISIDGEMYKLPDTPKASITPYTKTMEDIHTAITTGNIGILGQFLTYDTQCSPVKNRKSDSFTLDVAPFMEALYLTKKIDPLKTIVSEVINYKGEYKEELQKKFVTSLENTCLFEQSPLHWKEKISPLRFQLNKLEEYGKSLQNKKIAKGDVIVNLATQLKAKINQFADYKEDKIDPLTQIQMLQAKLEFEELLHSQDKILEQHRDLSKVFSNLASIIFTGGIANIIHKIATGKFLFFSETKSKELVGAVDQTFTTRPNSSTH